MEQPKTTSPSSPNDSWTIASAKAWLRNRLRKGERCPCCGQRAQMYRRKITASMVSTMAAVYREQTRQAKAGQGDPWVYLPDIPQHSRDFATLQYFGLVAQRPVRREDGGKAGWWRLTPNGEDFLLGQLTASKYALVFDGRQFGFEGNQITVHDIAPEFRYDELMVGA